MKLAKRVMAALLAALVALSMAGVALAAQEGELTGGSITINNAVPEQKYSVYQILYLESYATNEAGEATGAYAYKANSAWAEWLAGQTAYVAIDAQGYVTWVDGADVVAFAADARDFAEALTADATGVAPAAAEGEAFSTLSFTGLTLGYYLVDTSLGALCSLDTLNPNAVMREKNGVPEVVKEVQEDSTEAWGPSNDADFNQVVSYTATVTVQAGAENYAVHDVMDPGLTFDPESVVVTVDGAVVAASNYTLVVPGTEEGEDAEVCTFEVFFENSFVQALPVGTEIVVSYTATLNENARVGIEGNLNRVTLIYGDKNWPSCTPVTVTITYTWDLQILKYANGKEQDVLSGAQFVLLSADKTKVAIIEGGKLVDWATAPGDAAWPAGSVLVTDANGKIDIAGLDADTYYLREVKAPAGYNKLVSDVEVVIDGLTTDPETETLLYSTVVAKVNNQSGAELPSTGGVGTTVFYTLGSLFALGAVILLVTKIRMRGAKK